MAEGDAGTVCVVWVGGWTVCVGGLGMDGVWGSEDGQCVCGGVGMDGV